MSRCRYLEQSEGKKIDNVVKLSNGYFWPKRRIKIPLLRCSWSLTKINPVSFFVLSVLKAAPRSRSLIRQATDTNLFTFYYSPMSTKTFFCVVFLSCLWSYSNRFFFIVAVSESASEAYVDHDRTAALFTILPWNGEWNLRTSVCRVPWPYRVRWLKVNETTARWWWL